MIGRSKRFRDRTLSGSRYYSCSPSLLILCPSVSLGEGENDDVFDNDDDEKKTRKAKPEEVESRSPVSRDDTTG